MIATPQLHPLRNFLPKIAVTRSCFSFGFSLVIILAITFTASAQQRADSTARRIVQFESAIDPARYLLLPGQAISVVFLQSSLPSLEFEINAEGAIVFPTFGRIEVGRGLVSLKSFRERFETHLRQFYKSAQLDITAARPLDVTIELRGLVQRPGRYRISNALRLSDLIDTAGGILPNGSPRKIQVFGVDTQHVDLQKARVRGESAQNPFLYSMQSVEVKARGAWLRVEGDVRRPQSVEFLGNENIDEILPFVGGLIGQTISSVAVNDSKLSAPYSLSGVPSAAVVTVYTEEGRSIVVTGEVNRPSRRAATGQSVTQTLQDASGMKSTADPNRLVIWRRGRSTTDGHGSSYPMVVSSRFFDQQRLEAGDSLVVLQKRGYVEIEVEGRIRTIPSTSSLLARDIILLAGESSVTSSEVDLTIRDGATELESRASLSTPLYDGDRLIVRQKRAEK